MRKIATILFLCLSVNCFGIRIYKTGSATKDLDAGANIPLSSTQANLGNATTHPILVRVHVNLPGLTNGGADTLTWILKQGTLGATAQQTGTIAVTAALMFWESPEFLLGPVGFIDTAQINFASDNAGDTAIAITTTTYAISEDIDTKTWHVSKSGADTNVGNSVQDAFLTIQAAVDNTETAAGDTIIIHPGTYDEAVDLATKNEGLALRGTNRSACIISQATGDALTLGDDCTIQNLTIKALEAETGIAVQCAVLSDHIVIDNCIIQGGDIGLKFPSGKGPRVSNSIIEGSITALDAGGQDGIYTNCRISGAQPAAPASGTEIVVIDGINNSIFRNCAIRCPSRSAPTADTYIAKVTVGPYSTIFDHCILKAQHGGGSGDIIGVSITDAQNTVILSGCTFQTVNAGSGTITDLSNGSTGVILVSGTNYGSSSGTITLMNSKWKQQSGKSGRYGN